MKPISRVVFALALPLSAQVTLNQYATREFGQNTLVSNNQINSESPNLVDARALNGPTGIAFDYSVNPPRVWVADSGNNRVLGWNNANGLTRGNPADIVLGQHNFNSDLAGGPGTSFTTGLSSPTGVAVDAHGSVYVSDTGNNRILRFPNSAQNPLTSGAAPDMVLGQSNFSSGRSANQGLAAPTAKTLALNPYSGCCLNALTLDAQGNLWATDAGNNRVLRYPASGLAAGTSALAADTVIGQADFVSNQQPRSVNGDIQLSQTLLTPTAVAFDASGRLYVSDGLARALEFAPNPITGQAFDRVLGHPPTPAPGLPVPAYPTQSTLGEVLFGSIQAGPQGIFALGNNVFVADAPNNRVVFYDVYSNWGAATAASLSPLELSVLGQGSFFTGLANEGNALSSGTTLSNPVAGAINTTNNEMWIVDAGNNRVIAFPSNGTPLSGQTYVNPSRVLGQLDFIYSSPNLIEGKEVWLTQQTNIGRIDGGGIAVDSVSNPPNVYLYIADTRNNRVLGFKNGRAVGTDSRNPLNQVADLFIGQPNSDIAVINYSGDFSTSGQFASPSATGLSSPTSVAVDSKGNLYVTDTGNSRVVRFPAPFAQPTGTQPAADLVLGQSTLTTFPVTDPSQSHMSAPYGITIFVDGNLAVSDLNHNRILVFTKAPGSDFTSGQNATSVIGQTDFFSTGARSDSSSLSAPRHIASDSSDRIFVADSGNSRMIVFPNSAKFTNGTAAVLQVNGLSSPEGVAVSQNTGESWLASPGANQIYRFPRFETLLSTLAPDYTIPSPIPLALGLDAKDDLIVGEGINRVSFYYPSIYFKNSASYAAGINSTSQIAPGMLLNLGRYRSMLPLPLMAGFAPIPYQTTLMDIQVTVNGTPAPIYFLLQSIGWVYIQVPSSAPSSGTADFVIQQASTGQILGASTFPMQAFAPGLFTTNSAGTGQVAANNLDSNGNYLSNNGPNTPLSINNGIIVLYGTGQGYIPGAPPDGQMPGGAFSTPLTPTVYIGATPGKVLYSGLSPQFPGLWQIDVQVPPGTIGTGKLPVVVQMGDYTSNVGGTNSNAPGATVGEPGSDIPLTVPNNNITTMATH